MADIIPYSFPVDSIPQPYGAPLPGRAQGVYVAVHPEMLDDLAGQMSRWFAPFPEIEVVDWGTSDKQRIGFILVEWVEVEMNPLFLSILAESPMVGDYTTYGWEL